MRKTQEEQLLESVKLVAEHRQHYTEHRQHARMYRQNAIAFFLLAGLWSAFMVFMVLKYWSSWS